MSTLKPRYNEIIIEPEIILSLYWGNQYSLSEISRIFKCSMSTVENKLVLYDIERRPTAKHDMTIETRQRISNSLKGHIPWNKGTAKPKPPKMIKTKNPSWYNVSCAYCSIKFHRRKSHIHKVRNFCSNKCQNKWQETYFSGENGSGWKGGISYNPYSSEFTKEMKRFIRERDNYTCQECGANEKELKYKLDIHHIDFDKLNSKPNNLISLCRSCHSKTQYNRSEWIQYYNDKLKGDNKWE